LLIIKCPQLSKPKAKGNNGKEPELHQVAEWRRKKTWEKPGSVGGPVLFWPFQQNVQKGLSK